MSQRLVMSGHLMEAFMPYRRDEKRMLAVLERALDMGCYRNVELPVFPSPEYQKRVRDLLESHGVTAVTYLTPYLNERGLSLCDADGAGRRAAVAFVERLAEFCASAGFDRCGIPSGPWPGEAEKAAAMERVTDSTAEFSAFCAARGMDVTVEPLDRFAYKKQLIGPMDEAAAWVASLRETCPNLYLHWDSAHEALGGADLLETLALAGPYNAQIHLCDAITDPSHPCFGDLHKDVACAPDWTTEGVLTVETGAAILKAAAAMDRPATLRRDVHVSVEVLGHPGDDLWRKEERARAFLLRCAELAGVTLY